MNTIARFNQRHGVNISGIAGGIAGIAGLAILSLLAPYAVGYATDMAPNMYPALLAAAFAVIGFFCCVVSEKLLVSFGEPAYTVSQKMRQVLFVLVALFSVAAFAIASNMPLVEEVQAYYASSEAAALAGVPYEGPYPEPSRVFLPIFQIVTLTAAFFLLRKQEAGRSTFLIVMLSLVAFSYLALPVLAELLLSALVGVGLILLAPFMILICWIAVHEQTR